MRLAIFVVKTGESLGYGEKAINFTDFNVAADISEEEESIVFLSIKKKKWFYSVNNNIRVDAWSTYPIIMHLRIPW